LIFVAFVLATFVWRVPRRWWGRLRSVGRDVDVRPEADEVRRGQDLTVEAVPRGGGRIAGPVKLGLRCLERYDELVTNETVSHGGHRVRGSQRETREALAHEEWADARAEDGWSAVFTVPAAAPYSYEGGCLRFEWWVEAREVERFRPDRAATRTIRVLP
jgi:hypothetical protein